MRRPSRGRRPSKRQAILLGVVLGIVILAAAGLYVAISSKSAQLSQELAASKKRLAESRQLASRLVQCQNEYRAVEAKLTHLETFMPTAAYVPTLLQQIEDLAIKNHCTVVSIRPEDKPAASAKSSGSAEEGKSAGSAAGSASTSENYTNTPAPQKSDRIAGIDYDSQEFSIDIQGKYWDLVHLVEGLNSFPKIVAIGSVNIAPSPSAAGSGKVSHDLNLHIQMTAYLLKEGGVSNGRG